MIGSICITPTITDTRALVKKKYFNSLGLKKKVEGVFLIDAYTVNASLTEPEWEKAMSVLTNTQVEKASLNILPLPKKYDWVVEISLKPGVTDNLGATAKESIEDALRYKFKQSEGVYSSLVILLDTKASSKEVQTIANSLYNPLIQRAKIWSYREFKKQKKYIPSTAAVSMRTSTEASEVELDLVDNELLELGRYGITEKDGQYRGPLALDLENLKVIQKYFKKLGRNPTDVEIESIAQTWSEHCKHTIFNDPIDEIKDGLYATYIKGATKKIRQLKGKKDFCVSVFSDNSGIITFDKDFLVSYKVETHNSPSALDPFGGAITGIVGVNRDCIGTGLGAKPVINTYGFCLADPDDKTELYRDRKLTQKMLSARRIMEGVVAGINFGGNCSGIPTPQGFINFHERFRGKPLVFAGTVGILPKAVKGKPSHEKRAKPGDYIVMVGGRVGLDGIHGATFSSVNLDDKSPVTAVQIGDPITQKKLSDALIKEARDQGLYRSITDDGAGGLSCSVSEMAKESGGCFVNLEKVPLKYPGLSPWQIWISESQERMTLAVPPVSWKKLSELLKSRGVEATVIGKFTNTGKCIVSYKDKKVMDLDLNFLHEGRFRRQLKSLAQEPFKSVKPFGLAKNLSKEMLAMIERPNLSSYAFISAQYDHEVGASSIIKPLVGRGLVNGDASVSRPLLSSKKGVVLSTALYPALTELDSYSAAAASIDGAVRSAVSVGANIDFLALLDNFCWCSADDPKRLGQLKLAAKACFDVATAYGTPFISGKDSMFNDFSGYNGQGSRVKISIPPVLLISTIGVIEDVVKSVSLDVKKVGDIVYILGETNEELAGSEYAAYRGELNVSNIPKVNTAKNIKLYKTVFKAIQDSLIASAISVAVGGLGTALLRMSMAGKLGLEINLKEIPGKITRDDFALFSESAGRLVVSIAPENVKKFEQNFRSVLTRRIGKVSGSDKVNIRGIKGNEIVNLKLTDALLSYRERFGKY